MKCKKSEEEVQELEKEADEKCSCGTMPTDSAAMSTAERRTGAVMVDWAPRSGGASRAPHCPNSPRAVRRTQLAYRRPSTVRIVEKGNCERVAPAVCVRQCSIALAARHMVPPSRSKT